jgi:iron complex transport system ATP-binding protein
MGHVNVRGARICAGKRALFEHLDLDLLPGEFWAIVGPNGVGKTTLLRTLAGLQRSGGGEVLVDGTHLGRLTPRARAGYVALLTSDAPAPAGMSVRDVVATGRFAARSWWGWDERGDDLAAAQAALERVGLAELAERPCETLSSGERQRAWLALALAQRARTILLDEPTSHLDVRFAREILGLLRRIAAEGTTIVAVLHDLDEATDFADRVALLGDGTLLAAGPPREALAPAALQRAYGIAFEAVNVGGIYRVVPSTSLSEPLRR